jgi:nucleoside-diphosphate-sugar epimerase
MTTSPKVLVTGASGFIGRRLLAAMPDGWTVLAASRGGRDIAVGPGVRLDLLDSSSFANLPGRIDTVVHLAALIDAPSAEDYIKTNLTGTQRMLEYANKAKPTTFVYGSTGGVYGSASTPFRETDPLRPQDDYATSKAQAELAVAAFDTDMVKIVLRYCAPYDLGTPNPITRVISQVINGEEIPVSTGMYPRYNPLHLDDAVEMTVRSLTLARGCILNIAGWEATTFAGIALIAGMALGMSPRFRLVDIGDMIPYYRNDTFLEPTLAYDTLGYRPRIDLVHGISDVARKQAERAKSHVW